jgi:short-subunit dehydrogenase
VPHLLVVGAGPGISAAAAPRFGGEGYAVGLVARREEALAELGSALRDDGVRVEWATPPEATAVRP